MALSAEHKAKVVGDFQRASEDTGSTEVQVALMTARIEDLSTHFKNTYPRSPFPPGTAAVGQQTTKAAGLPQEHGYRALQKPDKSTWLAQIRGNK